MNITQEKSGDLTAIVKIELGKEDYQEKVDKVLKDYRKRASIPGFRPGKVPMGHVKKMYGKAVMAEEINKIISESLHNFLEENEMDTLASPLANKEKQQVIDFDTQDTYEFFFDVALKPEVTVDFEKATDIVKYEIEVEDKAVEDALLDMRKRFGEYAEVDTIEDEDLVYGDIKELDEEGNLKEGGVENHAPISIKYIQNEDIKKEFLAAKKGDTVKFSPMAAFMNEHEVSSMLGITKEQLAETGEFFNFTVVTSKRIEPAPVDEKMLKEVYPSDNLENEEQLRDRIREDIAKSQESEAEKVMMNDAFKKLLSETEINLPDEFMKRWLMESDQENKITEEDLTEHYDTYAESLKIGLLRNQLVKDNGLEINDEDIDNHIAGLLGLGNLETLEDESRKMQLKSVVDSVKSNQQQFEQIVDQVLDTKLIALFKENIKFGTKKVSREEFINLANA